MNSRLLEAEEVLFLVLLQLALIVVAGRLGRGLAARLGQALAAGEIVAGVLLGPSFFGWLLPGVFHRVFETTPPVAMYILSQVGLVLLMFQVGMEFDFSHLREAGLRRVVGRVAVASLVAPFVLGFAAGWWSAPALSPGADPLLSGLFVATALAITALPILGRIMIEFGIAREPLGVVAISAAAVNDVAGWLILAVITALAAARFDATAFTLRLAGIAGLGLGAWYLARPLLKRAVPRYGLGAGDAGPATALDERLLTILLVALLAAAMATSRLGIFPIFGAFLTGVLLHDEPRLVDAWRERVGHFVGVFFLPIFFTYTGLRTDIGGLDSVSLWTWCLVFLALATLGKLGAAYLAARWTGWSAAESLALGVLMNTRALMELIVLNVGLDLGVISRHVFTMLVLMAIVSTVATSPVLRRCLREMARGKGARRAGPR